MKTARSQDENDYQDLNTIGFVDRVLKRKQDQKHKKHQLYCNHKVERVKTKHDQDMSQSHTTDQPMAP